MFLSGRRVHRGKGFCMWCASFRLFVLTIPGWGPTSFSTRGSGSTGRIQPSGFTADANTDGQAHCLLMLFVVLWFFMGHCGLSSKCWAGGGGDCIVWSSYRWGLQDILLPGGKSASIGPNMGKGSWPSIMF